MRSLPWFLAAALVASCAPKAPANPAAGTTAATPRAGVSSTLLDIPTQITPTLPTSAIVAAGGGNVVSQGGGNVVSQGGGNALSNSGSSYHLQAGALARGLVTIVFDALLASYGLRAFFVEAVMRAVAK